MNLSLRCDLSATVKSERETANGLNRWQKRESTRLSVTKSDAKNCISNTVY